MAANYQIRPALVQDQQAIANMMFFEPHVHRHLDWYHPVDWLDSPLYWVLERNSHILATLACPQDQKDFTWIRLFAHVSSFAKEDAWQILWEHAKNEIKKLGNIKVAAIILHQWMQDLLIQSDFQQDQEILMLSWEKNAPPTAKPPDGIYIRNMTLDDLPQIVHVDSTAFDSLWQNPLSMLKQAHSKSIVSTVAESPAGILGYQISTKSPFGAHLGRLAVLPQWQRQGIASALLHHLLSQLAQHKITQLSVNTQSKNKNSIEFYLKNGFKYTEESYPLFTYEVSGNGRERSKNGTP